MGEDVFIKPNHQNWQFTHDQKGQENQQFTLLTPGMNDCEASRLFKDHDNKLTKNPLQFPPKIPSLELHTSSQDQERRAERQKRFRYYFPQTSFFVERTFFLQ